MAIDGQIVLGKGHRQPFGHANLFAHQIDAKDRLGHRMFHLKAGVHFDEIELAILIEEFDRARADVVDIGHRVGTDLTDPRAFLFGDRGAGGLFENLLVAALQRAVALAQMDRVALTIPKDLNLNVARGGEVFLDIDFVIAEVRLPLGPRGLEGFFHVFGGLGDFHALAAAACRGLDDDRIADLFAQALGVFERCDATIRAGHARHAELFHRVLGGDLVTHDADVFGGGADEGQTVVFNHLHKACVFRQETVAGVNRFGPGDLTGCDDRGDREVGLGRGGRADTDGFVGHAHMHRVAVGGGMHRDGLDAHLAGRADDAQRDLSPVGD